MRSILEIYTTIHVLISLAAILIGFPAIVQMLRGQWRSVPVVWFFALTALTCVTGFGFPTSSVTPAHVLGVITLALLGTSYYARSRSLNSRRFRRVCLLTALASQYVNVFVLIVQSFQKIGFLHALAPTQSELPFLLVQLLVAALFLLPAWKSFSL